MTALPLRPRLLPLALACLLLACLQQAPRGVASSAVRERREAPSGRKPAPVDAQEFNAECLAAHNKWRRLHGAPALEWDAKVAAFAGKRAKFIADSDGAEFRHPNDLVYGENLAWHSNPARSCAKLIKLWYDEEKMHSYKQPILQSATGHFTQLVWRASSRVGCAHAISSGPSGGIYLVCNYDPPGNFHGEVAENVLPAQKAAGDTPAKPVEPVAPVPVPAPVKPTPAPTGVVSSTSAAPAVTPAYEAAPSTTTSTTTTTTSTTTTTTKKPAKKKGKKKKKKKKNKSKKKAKTTTQKPATQPSPSVGRSTETSGATAALPDSPAPS